jgi:hypothetical protein
MRLSTWKTQLAGAQPFDTPATRAAQGERGLLTDWMSAKKPFVLSLSKHGRFFSISTAVFRIDGILIPACPA